MHKGDVGSRLIVATNNTALPGTDTLAFKITKPSGATDLWSITGAMLNTTTGVITFTTTAITELNEIGEYRIEIRRTTVAGAVSHSDVGNFKVEDVLW